MTHLTRDELVGWRDRPLPADRDRIVGHLSVCDACGALYAELIRHAEAPAPSRVDAREFVERGYRVYTPARPGRPTWRRWRVWLPAAAAVAAVLIVVVLVPRRTDTPSVSNEIRGLSIQLLGPAGAATEPIVFRWASPVRATSYTIEIRDEGGAVVSRLDAREEQATPPADLRNRMTPGGRYSWVVIAFDARGEEIMRSAAQTFVPSAAGR